MAFLYQDSESSRRSSLPLETASSIALRQDIDETRRALARDHQVKFPRAPSIHVAPSTVSTAVTANRGVLTMFGPNTPFGRLFRGATNDGVSRASHAPDEPPVITPSPFPASVNVPVPSSNQPGGLPSSSSGSVE